ncbi:hypothetical protein [Gluconobacter wancherniae]|uniref:hypothetical protein n=1 Tax=Gluconobacter wancherniae TaxID=1307955 RepID=UPI001B8CB52F|nr:hypothetical protein [Gluconobacter wancherniae]MBS1093838.1 hypothetical protein [Gluconobacter wancherniae]
MSASLNGVPGSSGYLVSDLINMSLRQIGVGAMGTTASDADLSDAVMHLNMMLAQWQRKRWLVPNLVDLSFVSTDASLYYVGPGGDLDTPVRPDKIEAAYARLLNGAPISTPGDFLPIDFTGADFAVPVNGLDGDAQPIDFPLSIIQAYEDYATIGLKALRTWPSFCHYNPAYPLGEFRPWPIPAAGIWEFHLVFKQPLQSGLKPADPINLPPEYWDAIMWTLAARIAPSYGQEASSTVTALAKSALNTIRTSNTQIPTLEMPAILIPISNPFYWPGLEIQKL